MQMRKFIKRTLIFNRWVSLLYFAAFALIALLTIFGIRMHGMEQIWQHNYEAASYRYEAFINGTSGVLIQQDELPKPNVGIFGAPLQITVGHDELYPISGCLIISINEDFQEELSWGNYPTEEEYSSNPCVVIGPGLKSRMYQIDGENYIDLFDRIPCRVTGIFKPITVERIDERFYLFWNQIPDDVYEELFLGGANNFYYIDSMQSIPEDELLPLYNLMEEKAEEKNETTGSTNLTYFDDGSYTTTGYKTDQPAAEFMKTMFYWVMCIFAAVSMLLLSYFWTLYQNKKWVIQFLCGMSAVRIAAESLLSYFFYELLGFGLVYGVYFVILLFQNGVSEFAQMLYACRGLIAALFLTTPLVVGILPFVKLLRMQRSLAVHLKKS